MEARTYINNEKGLIINLIPVVGESNGTKVYNWLLKNHEDIFYNDIELHEVGEKGVQVTPGAIEIIGDNGVLILERIIIKTI